MGIKLIESVYQTRIESQFLIYQDLLLMNNWLIKEVQEHISLENCIMEKVS